MTGAAIADLDGRRVLVVEDEFLIADDLARALGHAGAEVVGPFPSVSRAMAGVADARVDAAVLDVNLDGRMVWPLADVLLGRGVPVVLATGYASGAIPRAYAHLPHYEKPVSPVELARVVADRIATA